MSARTAIQYLRARKTTDLSFTYDLNHEVEKRTYSSAWFPISYNEILKMDKLIQNEGWDGWK